MFHVVQLWKAPPFREGSITIEDIQIANHSQFLSSSEVPAVTFSGTKPEDGHAMKMDACLPNQEITLDGVNREQRGEGLSRTRRPCHEEGSRMGGTMRIYGLLAHVAPMPTSCYHCRGCCCMSARPGLSSATSPTDDTRRRGQWLTRMQRSTS